MVFPYQQQPAAPVPSQPPASQPMVTRPAPGAPPVAQGPAVQEGVSYQAYNLPPSQYFKMTYQQQRERNMSPIDRLMELYEWPEMCPTWCDPVLFQLVRVRWEEKWGGER